MFPLHGTGFEPATHGYCDRRSAIELSIEDLTEDALLRKFRELLTHRMLHAFCAFPGWVLTLACFPEPVDPVPLL